MSASVNGNLSTSAAFAVIVKNVGHASIMLHGFWSILNLVINLHMKIVLTILLIHIRSFFFLSSGDCFDEFMKVFLLYIIQYPNTSLYYYWSQLVPVLDKVKSNG